MYFIQSVQGTQLSVMGIPYDFSCLGGKQKSSTESFDGKNLLNPESNKQALERRRDSLHTAFLVLSARDEKRMKVSSKQTQSLLPIG
jgi:hypothetical protein